MLWRCQETYTDLKYSKKFWFSVQLKPDVFQNILKLGYLTFYCSRCEVKMLGSRGK